MNGDEIRQFWPIPEPWSILPITQGVNNLTQVIQTPSGSYILRAYRRDRPLERIRYELHVLKRLRGKALPFQVPIPIPTMTGELFAVLSETALSLSTRLPGSPPQNDNLAQAYAAGEALAELVAALDQLKVEVTSQVPPFPPSDDFETWAGIPIIPANLLRELPLAKEEQEQILTLIERTQASVPALYQTLPQQIIHRDYDQSNILMEGNSVTGVLDFEFCGPDLRVIDLAYALSQWPSGLWNTGKEWAVIDAFGRGYSGRQKLTRAELEALPLIFHLRATTNMFFHLGRFAQGTETSEEILEGVRETLTTEAWLQIHAEELVKQACSWLD
ncbi:MAG TPA: phosphotransferase [Anaerolineales bacterium]|nr:phosphotransferase [Anaerolineales bacterium]